MRGNPNNFQRIAISFVFLMGPEFQVVVCNGFRSVRVSTSVIGRGAREGMGRKPNQDPGYDTDTDKPCALSSRQSRSAPSLSGVVVGAGYREDLALYAQSQRSECVTVGMKHKHTHTLTYALPSFPP